VLEPLAGYLLYAQRPTDGADVPPSLNFGPRPGDVLTVAEVADAMLAAFDCPRRWVKVEEEQPEEAKFLSIDPALALTSIGWRPRLHSAQALQWTADWYRAVAAGAGPRAVALDQIDRYEALA
jgi:CDP-glucose 4,6-dehydratase